MASRPAPGRPCGPRGSTRMMVVFVRSRPARYRWAEWRPARNCASAAGSPARACSTLRGGLLPRRHVGGAATASGAAESSVSRSRSMRTSARAGSVSQVSERMSHSLGPRLPCSRTNVAKAARKARPPVRPPPPRAARPRRGPSKAAISSAEARTWRLSAQSSRVGTAESTSPTPDTRVSGSSVVAQRGGDGTEDAGPDRRGRGDLEVALEQAADQRHEGAGPGHQLLVGHRPEIRPGGTGRGGLVPVGPEVGQVLGHQHLAHPRADAGRAGLALVPGLGDVRRDVGVLAEVDVVDHLRRQPGRPDAEDPRHRGVDVEVAAEAAHHLGEDRVHVLTIERADAHCVSAQPMTTPGSHTNDQASGLTGSGSTSPALALV